MIRTTVTALVSATSLFAVSEPFDPPIASADIVKDALCVLQRLPPTNLPDGAVAALLPPEEFRCDFTQTMGALMSTARAGLSSFRTLSRTQPSPVRTQRISSAGPARDAGITGTRQPTERQQGRLAWHPPEDWSALEAMDRGHGVAGRPPGPGSPDRRQCAHRSGAAGTRRDQAGGDAFRFGEVRSEILQPDGTGGFSYRSGFLSFTDTYR